MNTNKYFFISLAWFFSFSVLFQISSYGQKAKVKTPKPELVFQSGFEGTTQVVSILGRSDYGALYEKIIGNDTSFKSKSNWDKDWVTALNPGFMEVQYTGGDSSKRFIKVGTDPTNARNKVLHFWLNDSWLASEGQYKARTQTNIYGIKNGFKEFYQSVRVFLAEDFNVLKSYPNPIPWCTISEFWNNAGWSEKNGFRLTLGIGKYTAGNEDLHFILDAQDHNLVDGKWQSPTIWSAPHSDVAVPIGKWFTMEYYFKEGDAKNGRFYLAITPDGGKKQVIYDIINFTHCTFDPNPNGLNDYNPMKLYTSTDVVSFVRSKGKTLQIYWDDFKLWENKRP